MLAILRARTNAGAERATDADGAPNWLSWPEDFGPIYSHGETTSDKVGAVDGMDIDFEEVSFDGLLALTEQWLRANGVQTGDPEALAWVAAVGAFHRMVRNGASGAWERLHMRGRMDDGAMMRSNAQGVRIIHGALLAERPWVEIADEVTSPDRRLPDGRTLADVAANRGLGKIRKDANEAGKVFNDTVRVSGYRASQVHATMALMGFGSGFAYGRRWHGMPDWPRIVERFCAAVDNPDDPHWTDGYPTRPRPKDIADTAELRRLLLAGPDMLSAEGAEWITSDGMLGLLS